MKHLKFTFLLLFAAALGCQSSYDVRSYDITVKNFSATPITVWLTKDGEPFEPGWLSPEDLATESPNARTRVISGLVIQSTKTAFTGPRHGQFQPGTHAILRFYSGQLTFEQLLAVDAGDSRRIDYELHPGPSHLIVTGDADRLKIKEEEPAP
jgi:hypothetical protein